MPSPPDGHFAIILTAYPPVSGLPLHFTPNSRFDTAASAEERAEGLAKSRYFGASRLPEGWTIGYEICCVVKSFFTPDPISIPKPAPATEWKLEERPRPKV